MNLVPSENLAYWVGVAQTDGRLKKERRKNGKFSYYVQVGIVTSIPMLKKFRKISNEVFERNNRIYFHKKSGQRQYKIGISKILPLFKNLDIDFSDPPKPPVWCTKNVKFFGAYLAGVIDGDGDVRVKRPKYAQCAIRIASSKPQENLQKYVNKILNCSSNIIMREGWKVFPNGKKYFLKTYNFEFLVSKNNYDIILENIVPHISMIYKKNKIVKFIKIKKRAATGI